jgi:hypothetical protein
LSLYTGSPAQKLATYLGLTCNFTDEKDHTQQFEVVKEWNHSEGRYCCENRDIGPVWTTPSGAGWIDPEKTWTGTVDFTKPGNYTMTVVIKEREIMGSTSDCPRPKNAVETVTASWTIRIIDTDCTFLPTTNTVGVELNKYTQGPRLSGAGVWTAVTASTTTVYLDRISRIL